jgi:hydroxypyruvate isomerase
MKILNFSSKSDAELAALVDKQLGRKYNVETASAYSTLVEKKDYLSAGNQATEGRTASVWKQSADRIRQAASQAIDGELKRRGKAAAQRAGKAIRYAIKKVRS